MESAEHHNTNKILSKLQYLCSWSQFSSNMQMYPSHPSEIPSHSQDQMP